MKKLGITLMALIFSVSIFAKDLKELVVTTTPPMSCQNCENKIKGNLRFEKGVKKIETNLKDQRVIIEYDAEKTTPEKIEEAFQKIGYKTDVIDGTTPSCETPQGCGETKGCGASEATSTCGGGCCKNK